MNNLFKFLFAMLFVSAVFFSFGQATGNAKFNYQAVVHLNDTLLRNSNVDIRFQIYDASVAGNLTYQEDFLAQSTGSFGVVNLQVGGNGNVTLQSLNWGTVNYYVNIQMKQGGNQYNDIASNRTQLASVPYALFAQKSDTANYALTAPQTVFTAGAGISISGNAITNTAPGATYTAGTGISIASNAITNTAPDRTVTITGNGITVSGAYPNFTITATDPTPAGTIVAFGGTTPPAGWLFCDGAPYPTATYAALYTAIGFAFGGSGSQFNVPDLRGRFLRGVDGSAGNDPDVNNRTVNGNNPKNAPGSIQEDAFQGHWHSWYYGTATNYQTVGSAGVLDIVMDENYYGTTVNNTGTLNNIVKAPVTDGTNGTPRTSSETRPKNVYVNYIIKQ